MDNAFDTKNIQSLTLDPPRQFKNIALHPSDISWAELRNTKSASLLAVTVMKKSIRERS